MRTRFWAASLGAVCLIGLKLHILDHGSTFNLHSRVAAAAPVIAKRV